ncbi:hypothetical protein BDV28DRAFT_137353 [Aspergillus coremiiformis]|uniref:MYND-type domain-containing protein n=1 Tax=Aspergillus coremiiformis TaxID=138285 RepID=A0A5N6Z0V5_9EURO|nr:hypothetical protein BDV28DRAFT_137353 [Aspergillus coremiiformis]
MASIVLPSGCGICGKKQNLFQCAGCKVMLYCGREHQVAHRESHKSACSIIRRRRATMDQEEQALRNCPGDFMMPAGDAFVNCVGHFWGLLDTRDYMRARFGVVEAMSQIKSEESVHSQLDHSTDLLRLCRSDNMGVRGLVPALMLRLNKDQDCYDFLKWWNVINDDFCYDWGNMDLPYLDIKNADAFESASQFCREYLELSHVVAITLLKIKMLFDLVRLEESTRVLGTKLPREIFDLIQSSLPQSPVVASNREIMSGTGRREMIEELEDQIDDLYEAVDDGNRYFWPGLQTPSMHLAAEPQAYSRGSKEEMQLVLQMNYDAWMETPGAIEFIEAKMY